VCPDGKGSKSGEEVKRVDTAAQRLQETRWPLFFRRVGE